MLDALVYNRRIFGESIHRRAVLALAILKAALRSRLFLGLAILDAFFVMLHIFLGTRAFSLLEHPVKFFRLGEEYGLPELLEHLLLSSAAAACLVLAFKIKQNSYLMVLGIILCLLADNLLQLHEHFGAVISPSDQNLGELAIMGANGTIFLLTALFFYNTASAHTQPFLAAIMMCFAWLAIFGIAIDFANGGIAPYTTAKAFFLLVEEVAELLGMSLLAVILIRRSVESLRDDKRTTNHSAAPGVA